jgi:16S rRNA (adenine1518-N6/adenine1519-N6)-dimethyltransferase
LAEYIHKKSLGQHFLHSQAICMDIVALAKEQFPNWLEVGPGAGAITKYLLEKNFATFNCIEIDTEKVAYLQKTLPALKDKIINADFLKYTPPANETVAIIGNFPYNISTQIIFRILDFYTQVPYVIGMFQKEVADRFAAKHGNKTYGITSVIAQCFYKIEHQFNVAPDNFIPPPKVNSAVITMQAIGNPYNINNFKQFKTFVKAAFSQRRKTLRNALKSVLPAEKLVNEIFNMRAEQLSVEDFANLYHSLYTNG